MNLRLTGSPTEFPITVADPLDRFGFGMRRLMPKFDDFEYGPRLASISTGRNAFWLPFFLIGAHLGVVVAAVGAWQRRREASRPRSSSPSGAAFPIAYFMFFGTNISSLTARLSGPIYYVPAYAALCGLIAIALAAHRSPTTGCRGPPGRGPRAREHPDRRQPVAGEPPAERSQRAVGHLDRGPRRARPRGDAAGRATSCS